MNSTSLSLDYGQGFNTHGPMKLLAGKTTPLRLGKFHTLDLFEKVLLLAEGQLIPT